MTDVKRDRWYGICVTVSMVSLVAALIAFACYLWLDRSAYVWLAAGGLLIFLISASTAYRVDPPTPQRSA